MNKIEFAYHPELDQNPNNIAKVQQNQNQDPEVSLLNQIANTFPNFDLKAAYDSGYSAQEIAEYLGKQTQASSNNSSDTSNNFDFSSLSKKHPNFDFQAAVDAGYSPEEIQGFLKKNKPKKSLGEKSARIAGQYALGVAENALLPYELAVAPLASKEAQNVQYRETLSDDLERLMDQKAMGQWDEQDQALYDSIVEQILDPRKSMENVQTADIGVRGLAEKATGQDLKPEGVLEKAANWSGLIKDPRKLAKLAQSGIKLPDVIKAFTPTGKESLRGLTTGAALEMAEAGEFGPIGTLASAVVGDVLGHGIGNTAKLTKNLITKPKETLADVAASFTKKDKLDLQKQVIKDFRDSGIQADLGSITDSDLIKWTQSRLAQSGLVGKDLKQFRNELTDQIKAEYKGLADALGESRFSTMYEAGESLRAATKEIRDADLKSVRKLYENAANSLKNDKNAYVDSRRIADSIERIEKDLRPGAIKSGEQKVVLDTLEKLKQDVFDSSGRPMFANVKDLINNKIALQDIINYEVQGGTKQLLKGVVADLDRAIIQHGKNNPTFAKNYIQANKKFADHAKTFRNKNIEQILFAQDPEKVINKMNSIQGIRDVGKILSKTPEGKKLFDDLKRLKLDKVIGDNLIDSTTKQAKLGTFSKLLEKGKNRDLIKEILDPVSFKRLEKLQKNSGKLADAVQKFYNASQSGVVAVDAAIIAKGMSTIANLLQGNPWPMMKIGGGFIFAKKIGKLLADPEFLKLTEEAILASQKGTEKQLIDSFSKLGPFILKALQSDEDEDDRDLGQPV